MKANVLQIKGVTFIGKGESNHWVSMDGPEQFQGSEAGTRPKELVLIALAGCSGSDIASILNKMREKVNRFEIDVDSEVSTEHPKVFTKIHLIYKFLGVDLKKSNIEKAINLSQEKYCSVSAMLKPSVNITYDFEITEDISE